MTRWGGHPQKDRQPVTHQQQILGFDLFNSGEAKPYYQLLTILLTLPCFTALLWYIRLGYLMQATSNRGKLYSMVRSRIFLVTVNFAWLKPLLDRTTGNYLLTLLLDGNSTPPPY
ncbi:hypothetical protein MCOR07_000713 [Pyricularia oryzae]|uniref:Uncharacterized protein n=4 Tax=Pyricularia oryzae TaxID=318829 RepID=G4NB86_PYRO7|nr:uncharacterized protein MGG_14671 [Pyricularia oryzae 70-15]ELQ38748.1 hypothetical protein OOU_Y34scaffold00528g40 [Pyricularia oryzae Y34]KAI6317670.1 hypothetical protein MCOR29_006240 [Pyricularia oryzae]EHA48848.1 hypothetical protein MGG_14671 [Pyricularia oryzae 70-15]KAI6324270.1 hypothetical protein MCOR34_001571 [Pyricularia oryzae]KAI6390869.1 hypothetical protein MCOR23_009318 [Pyricularia oryzae]